MDYPYLMEIPLTAFAEYRSEKRIANENDRLTIRVLRLTDVRLPHCDSPTIQPYV
jgi:hypothetical protein